MKFSQKFAALRMEYGYSQEELAERLHVSRQAVSKWELGTTLPDTEKIIAIADVFNVPIDYLLREGSILDDSNLDRVVLKFLGSAQDMDQISKELLSIVSDGIIDESEKPKMKRILDTLDSIADIIHEIKRKMDKE